MASPWRPSGNPLAPPLSCPLLCSGGCSVKWRESKRTWSVRDHCPGASSGRAAQSWRPVVPERTTYRPNALGSLGNPEQAVSRRGASNAAMGWKPLPVRLLSGHTPRCCAGQGFRTAHVPSQCQGKRLTRASRPVLRDHNDANKRYFSALPSGHCASCSNNVISKMKIAIKSGPYKMRTHQPRGFVNLHGGRALAQMGR
jgi:hypothetical protein